MKVHENKNTIFVCDECKGIDQCCIIWELPDRDGHFCLCRNCLRDSFLYGVSWEYKINESIQVKRKVIRESIRDSIFNRDDNKCIECGSKDRLEIDHIIPFSLGGKTDVKNLQTMCKKCNMEKRDQYESIYTQKWIQCR